MTLPWRKALLGDAAIALYEVILAPIDESGRVGEGEA